MISVVCVYNDGKVLRDYLEAGLDAQTAACERILLDNSNHRYPSAAKALNEGAAKATGRYLLFIHQDVRVHPGTWLADAERMLDSLTDVGMAGLAGKRGFEGIRSNITHGDPPGPAGHARIDRVETTQTVDECAIFVPRSVFVRLRFDEDACDDWHLYGVDYALGVKKLGLEVLVLPLGAHHGSTANSMSDRYYRSLGKVLRKHREDCGFVFTTMGEWHTRVPIPVMRFLRRTRILVTLSRLRRKIRPADEGRG